GQKSAYPYGENTPESEQIIIEDNVLSFQSANLKMLLQIARFVGQLITIRPMFIPKIQKGLFYGNSY
ncbi:MAG: hypothetical protein SOX11_12840, partial [Lachnospiraceae bacterium]|nr:hypothetical protein [Lachnospiraceae bacterium]